MKSFGFILASIIVLLSGFATANAQKSLPRFQVCHGYDCYYQTSVTLTAHDLAGLYKIFSHAQNAQSERAAIKQAVALFEERSTVVIGVRDEPKMAFGKSRRKGQMDCIDESKNTESFLTYLQKAGFMRFHKVAGRDSRGFFLDMRYPHWTAVIRDQLGVQWAVDSWFEAGGGLPDIMPLKEWKKRGVNGKR